jgi:gamma-glutamylputrescine oxidase
MRTRYGVSPWIDDCPRKRRPDFPRFRGSETGPVAIIGGGLAGCLTAYAFAAAGIKVVLFESGRLGEGGAGRGPGILRGEAALSFRDIDSRHGRKAARALFEGSRRAVLDLVATARRLGAKTEIDTCDAIRLVAAYGDGERSLQKELAARRDAGLEGTWLKASAAARETAAESVGAGVRLHDWGHANPYQLLTLFARAAAERGALLFERSAVRRVKVRRRNAEVLLEGGTFTTDAVVVCTGEPTELYRPLKRHVRADESYVVLTDRLPASVRKTLQGKAGVVTDAEAPPHYVRWTGDGRLLVSGGDQVRPAPRAEDKVLVQRTGQLMYELSRMYPAISGVMPAYGWQLPLGTTADGVMYAGPHRNYPHHLFAWATRHDPAQAFLASRIMLRHYLGETHRDDAYFAFTRG